MTKTPWSNIEQSVQIPANINTGNVPTIAIAIPYITMEPEWVEKVYSPLRNIPVNYANKKFCLSKVPSISTARNALVQQAMDAEADYIWWLDTDMSFEDPTNVNGFADPNAALASIYSVINKDPNSRQDKIVSGLYRAKQKVGLNYAAWMWVESHKGYSPIQEWTGNFITVDVVGLGCCLMDIRVFKEMPRPWFHWDEVTDVSEDFYMLRKAKELGYNCNVFTEIKLSHLGKIKVRCNGTVTTAEM